jgi:hypothetical protein
MINPIKIIGNTMRRVAYVLLAIALAMLVMAALSLVFVSAVEAQEQFSDSDIVFTFDVTEQQYNDATPTDVTDQRTVHIYGVSAQQTDSGWIPDDEAKVYETQADLPVTYLEWSNMESTLSFEIDYLYFEVYDGSEMVYQSDTYAYDLPMDVTLSYEIEEGGEVITGGSSTDSTDWSPLLIGLVAVPWLVILGGGYAVYRRRGGIR